MLSFIQMYSSFGYKEQREGGCKVDVLDRQLMKCIIFFVEMFFGLKSECMYVWMGFLGQIASSISFHCKEKVYARQKKKRIFNRNHV